MRAHHLDGAEAQTHERLELALQAHLHGRDETRERSALITLLKKMGIRARFRQDRSLFRSTARLVTRLLTRWMRGRLSIQQDPAHAHPGIVLAQQSFGDQIKIHPHYHVLTTAGLFLSDGSFHSVSDFDEAELTAGLRRSVLSSLVRRNLLLPENAEKMQSWPLERSGFNVYPARSSRARTETGCADWSVT